MKRRWLRILLTVLLLLSIAGFGAFSTFFFNPFEGGYEHDLASLIPREVDFYLGKTDLRSDFDPFPTPAVLDELRANPSGEALLQLPAVARLEQSLGASEALAQLQASLDQLPVKVDVLEVFGGEKVALAGMFRGRDFAAAEWAVYGHVNWMGKLAVELLRYPDLLGLSERGLVVDEQESYLALSGAQLARPVYLTRIRDVVVAASSAELASRAHELEGSRGENSFALSAKYADHIGMLPRDGDEYEVFVDYRSLSDSQGWPRDLPNPAADVLPVALAGRLFQLGLLRDVIGIVGFDKGVSVRLTSLVSAEDMSPVQKRLYRERGFDKSRALDVSRLAPADTGFFAYMHADVGDLLREALAASSESEQSNLDDLSRTVWDKSSAELIDELDLAFKDRMGLVLRELDFPDEGETGPPHNDAVVPAWGLILSVNDKAKLEQLRERIVARQNALQIKGREPGARGVFIHTIAGNYKTIEYWSELVPGTGHIAVMDLGDDYFLVSNHTKMLELMFKTYFDGAPHFPRLADEGGFRTLVNTGLASTNVLAWLDPRALDRTLRALVDVHVRDAIFIDWSTERPRIEKEILAKEFPGERYGAVSPGVQQQLDILYEQAANAFEDEVHAKEGPRLRAELQRQVNALELLKGMLVELSVDQKRLDLFVRALVPLDEPQPVP